ncbi:MAG: hypothetical protein ACI4LX_07825 [Treponema sp.]
MKETEDPSQKEAGYENAENNSRFFHEERMKNAPKIVQDYYNGTGLKFEKGLFRVLVAKKSNRIIFLIMVFCFAIVFITNNFSNKGNLKVINGYECELQSFSYDDRLFASVKIHPVKKTKTQLSNQEKKSGESVSFPVKIVFYGISESGVQMKFQQDVNGEIFLNSNIYRTESDDYNVTDVIAEVSVGDESGELSVKVNRRLQ